MRLFVALDLPWTLRRQLSDLATGLAGMRWVPPENYHLSLRFLGELQRDRAEEVDLALAALRGRGFGMVLNGVGTHEKNGRVTALWAGVSRNPALEHLQGKIDTTLHRAGIGIERRRFVPHVTLARFDRSADPGLVEWVQARNLFRSDPVQVGHFTLFSSVLGKEQPVYSVEVEYELTPPGGGDAARELDAG